MTVTNKTYNISFSCMNWNHHSCLLFKWNSLFDYFILVNLIITSTTILPLVITSDAFIQNNPAAFSHFTLSATFVVSTRVTFIICYNKPIQHWYSVMIILFIHKPLHVFFPYSFLSITPVLSLIIQTFSPSTFFPSFCHF